MAAMTPKWCFCVGMRRGGSTLQAQLVAAILGDSPIQLTTPAALGSLIDDNEHTVGPLIVKSHRFLPEAVELARRNEARILYVHRDVRDAAASIVRKYNIPPFAFVHGGLSSLLDEAEEWMSVPDIYIGRYETMIADIPREVLRLAEYLGVMVTAEQSEEIGGRLSLSQQRRTIAEARTSIGRIVGTGRNVFDRHSLLHLNHIQSGGSGDFVNILPLNVIAALEGQARDWLIAHNYPLTTTRLTQLVCRGYFKTKALLHNARHGIFGRSSRECQ